MTEIPKIAKSRLRQQQGGALSAHLDADLLAAFSEHSLQGVEREQVLAHLAVCPECREVVSLSLPEEPVSSRTQPAREFLGMPADFLRWGVVAASAAVVVAAVLLVKPEIDRPPSPRSEMAKVEPAPASSVSPAASAPSKDAKADAEAGRGLISATTGSSRASAQSKLAAPPPPPAQSTQGRGMAKTLSSSSNVAEMKLETPSRVDALNGPVRNEPVAPAPAESTADAAKAGFAYSEKEKQNEMKMADAAVGQAAKKDETAPAGQRDTKLFAVDGVADTAAAAEMAPATSTSQLARMRQAMAKHKADTPRTWRITEGQLEWSLDGGKSWQKVNAPGGARFLSVDWRRSSVWAGGTSGVVIRSVDGGSTWVPVSTGWTGDVVYLRFEDEKRGRLKTSTGEEWFTDDGGSSWKKR